MTLSAGTRLGAYEILAPIGAGGMGEVYFPLGKPRVLFEFDHPYQGPGFDITPDGQHFIIIQGAERGVRQVNVVFNWLEELENLDPTE